jgi:thioesterase domain-containing protein
MAVRLRDEGREVALVLLDTGRPGQRVSQDTGDSCKGKWMKSRTRHVLRGVYLIVRRVMWRVTSRGRADHRFWLFLEHGIRAARHHVPRVFDGPMLVVQVKGSLAAEAWTDQPLMTSVTVGGDHNSMCHAPYVNEVIDEINSFVTQCREARY